MTFDEFFKKKKISLVAFEKEQPALFSEFKVHFEQMGEKSFDHTKKYWFNRLRLRFPAPPEVKAEKVLIENPLAEQTINEALSETPVQTTPDVGFKPRFKPGVTKPVASAPETAKDETEKLIQSTEAAAPAPAVGFKPRFKAGVTKPVEPVPDTKPAQEAQKPKQNENLPVSPVGFKPRFKTGATKPADQSPEQRMEPKDEE